MLDTRGDARRADAHGDLIVDELDGVAAACARLADEHRATVDGGAHAAAAGGADDVRLKAAGWLVGVARRARAPRRLRAPGAARRRGRNARRVRRPAGIEVLRLLRGGARPRRAGRCRGTRAARRSPSSAAALAAVARRRAKIGLDVVLLAQTEVGEVSEARDGRSSTMPHKRNPVGPVLARAVRARRARSRPRVLAERRARARARRRRLARGVERALRRARAARAVRRRRCARLLEGLEVDADQMRANMTTLSPSATRPKPSGLAPASARAGGSISAARSTCSSMRDARVAHGADERPCCPLRRHSARRARCGTRRSECAAPTSTWCASTIPGTAAQPMSRRTRSPSSDLARRVLGLLDDLGVERVLVCGLSLGGMVGQCSSRSTRPSGSIASCSRAPARVGDAQAMYDERIELVRARGAWKSSSTASWSAGSRRVRRRAALAIAMTFATRRPTATCATARSCAPSTCAADSSGSRCRRSRSVGRGGSRRRRRSIDALAAEIPHAASSRPARRASRERRAPEEFSARCCATSEGLT